MAQVVQSGARMRTSIHPTQAVAQGIEDPMSLAFAEWLPQSLPTTTDEERRVRGRREVSSTLPPVASQRLGRARMDG